MIDQWNGQDLARITAGTWDKTPPIDALHHVEIDHRQLGETGLFIALAGTKQDGHDYLPALKDKQCALVKSPSAKASIPQLQVTDPLQALDALAKTAMATTTATKIAVTGSVGKTGTRAALTSILQSYGTCHANKGNLNNHIGAPLSMLRTPSDADYIILEMGMNHQGEISPLSQLFDGDIAIITKIADSHIGHFASIGDIAHAKAEIFDGMTSGTAILPYDDDHFPLLADKASAQGLRLISFGAHPSADIQLISQSPLTSGQTISLINHLTGDKAEFTFGLTAKHYANTALILIAALHALGLDWQGAKSALADVQEVSGRGDITPLTIGAKTTFLINDSYNAGPASMQAALRDFKARPQASKALILTDMLELGSASDEAHLALIPLIADIAPDTLILIGEAMGKLASSLLGISDKIHILPSDDAPLSDAIIAQLLACDIILIKGSNGSGAPRLARTILALSAPSSTDLSAAHPSINGGAHHVS